MSTTKTRKKATGHKTKVHKTVAKARFDARLSISQKRVFEEAARIKGFKSLSEFVIHTTMEVATIIIERHKAILVSENDKEIFFNALANPPKPNKDLMQAAKYYQNEVAVK